MWSNLGSDYAGTLFAPSLTARSEPVLGATITLDLDNSAGIDAVALLLIGHPRARIATNRDGDLLVDPAIFVPLALPALGRTIPGTIPDDARRRGALTGR